MPKTKLIELDPKPSTVKELFDGHPERWNRGSMWKGEQGNTVPKEAAVSCCLGAALGFVYEDNAVLNAALNTVLKVLQERTHMPNCTVPWYNDYIAPGFDAIMEVVKEANV